MLTDLDIERPGDLRSNLRGHLRSKRAKVVILLIVEAVRGCDFNPTSEAVRGCDLKSDLYARLRQFEAAVLDPTFKSV